jgi:predicted PurR-regulated permease PerM
MKDKNNILNQIIKDTGKGIRGYIKAQLTLMFITFIILSIGFNIIDIRFSILIALAIAALDILPVIGSGIIMLPWALINFILGNIELAKGLAILYVILLIARQIIEPYVLGKNIGVRPLYTFIATILGSIILGPMGIIIGPLVAVIITSILRSKDNYKNRR